jgi:teichuronic acid biosynthesis glycosyltransferase TuaG
LHTVSVIIPTYNRKNDLINAIESVIKQDHPILEIIICDDFSNDGTSALIKSLNHKNIIYIKSKFNSGRPAIPRNLGLNIAQGDWVAFLDSDDIWSPNKISRQLEYAIKYNVNAICCNANRLENGIINGLVIDDRKKGIIPRNDLFIKNYIICSSALIKKKIFSLSGDFPEQLKFKAIEDYFLWLKISFETDWYFLNEPLVLYNDDIKNSIRGTMNHSHFQQRNTIFFELLKENISLNLILKILFIIIKNNILFSYEFIKDLIVKIFNQFSNYFKIIKNLK